MPVIPDIARQGIDLIGADHGATISLIFDYSDSGQGPRLHRHPYDETWVVEEGTVTFQAGQERFQATAGDVVVVPPDTPHKFTNDGPTRSKMVCIHANPTFDTEWLE
jgi:mannose-6-phosphate isomerase-like protein (cupin superfamily)